jgi:hypothetical protein
MCLKSAVFGTKYFRCLPYAVWHTALTVNCFHMLVISRGKQSLHELSFHSLAAPVSASSPLPAPPDLKAFLRPSFLLKATAALRRHRHHNTTTPPQQHHLAQHHNTTSHNTRNKIVHFYLNARHPVPISCSSCYF